LRRRVCSRFGRRPFSDGRLHGYACICPWPYRRCWSSWPNPRLRWLCQLVVTAEENRLISTTSANEHDHKDGLVCPKNNIPAVVDRDKMVVQCDVQRRAEILPASGHTALERLNADFGKRRNVLCMQGHHSLSDVSSCLA
jgi:hypothetical protein